MDVELKKLAQQWLQLDNEIVDCKTKIISLKDKKDELEPKLLHLMEEVNVKKINFNNNNDFISRTQNTVKVPIKDSEIRSIIFDSITDANKASELMSKIITHKNNNKKVYNRIKRSSKKSL